MNDNSLIAGPACFPAYDEVMNMELLRASLAFAITLGNHERASELADHILDVMRP